MSDLLGVRLGNERITETVWKINKFLSKKNNSCFHIANLNPDILTLAYTDKELRRIINQADSILIDGIGIIIAAKILKKNVGERLTGTDLMEQLVKLASKSGKKVMFLGGKNESAKNTAINFKKRYKDLQCIYDQGSSDIKKETAQEKNDVLKKIKEFKTDFLFVSYGPPYQEKWVWENKDNLKGIVCMGVGGAFNFLSGRTLRAPKIIVFFGFEWLWRLILEPGRIKKFHRVLYFAFLIFRLKISKITRFN